MSAVPGLRRLKQRIRSSRSSLGYRTRPSLKKKAHRFEESSPLRTDNSEACGVSKVYIMVEQNHSPYCHEVKEEMKTSQGPTVSFKN